jgi:pimeloyl-ACP methyl ester carboxylesterase
MSEPSPQGSNATDDNAGRGRRILVGVVVALLVLAIAGAGFAALRTDDGDPTTTPEPSPSASSASTTTPSPSGDMSTDAADPALRKYYGQDLDWSGCGDSECATLEVPLDYDHPEGKAIRLAVLRVPASDEDERLGAIVVNPGGPGGSGVQYAAGGALQFGQVLTRYYDIVGFDPRGVGQSTPLECIGTQQLDDIVEFDPDPDTTAERQHLDRMLHDFGAGCLKNSGDLARHMSTVEAAKDIDILRAALGEKKLDYLGASYGTFLGATYANLFPDHVDKMVLDGALDPALSNEELSLQQAHGFETALRAYLQNCVDQGGCYLGDSVDEGAKRIQDFYDQLERQPLRTSDPGRPLTAGLGMVGTWLPLYVKSFWPQLTDAMRSAMQDGNGTGLLKLADLYLSRGPSSYTDNSMEVLYAVNCLDHNDSIPSSQVPSHFAEFEKASPTFGRAFAFGLSTCSTWPIKTGHATHALHAKGAPPILVIGTTRDPATPLEWAKSLAKELDSGVLIVRDGDGHTGFNMGNSCVDDAVEDYFTKGKAPKDGLRC